MPVAAPPARADLEPVLLQRPVPRRPCRSRWRARARSRSTACAVASCCARSTKAAASCSLSVPSAWASSLPTRSTMRSGRGCSPGTVRRQYADLDALLAVVDPQGEGRLGAQGGRTSSTSRAGNGAAWRSAHPVGVRHVVRQLVQQRRVSRSAQGSPCGGTGRAIVPGGSQCAARAPRRSRSAGGGDASGEPRRTSGSVEHPDEVGRAAASSPNRRSAGSSTRCPRRWRAAPRGGRRRAGRPRRPLRGRRAPAGRRAAGCRQERSRQRR